MVWDSIFLVVPGTDSYYTILLQTVPESHNVYYTLPYLVVKRSKCMGNQVIRKKIDCREMKANVHVEERKLGQEYDYDVYFWMKGLGY